MVSRAIVSQMETTRHPNVYLDLTHLDPQRVMSRFPGIAAVCASSIWTLPATGFPSGRARIT